MDHSYSSMVPLCQLVSGLEVLLGIIYQQGCKVLFNKHLNSLVPTSLSGMMYLLPKEADSEAAH